MSIGDRLKLARNKKSISQDELAKTIGVSRGVITNIEYDKVEMPQKIILDAIAQALNIRKEWLLTGEGCMEDQKDSARILAKLYEAIRGLSENEQLFLLDTIKDVKKHFGNRNFDR